MLLACMGLILACGFISATPDLDYTPAERERVLGPFADVNLDFPCQGVTPSPTVPTSVHQLRPGDIKYIGAIGDSLTAASGAGASLIFGLLTEYRGLAWSIGGQDDLANTITLPNILRKCGGTLNGYSLGNGGQNSSNARFNLARPGAVSDEMPGQANLLADRMIQELGQTTFEQSWKMVNFFIGGNDLCACCNDQTRYSPDAFLKNIKDTLDILKARMPRTLVNYVTVLNVAELEDLHEGLVCQGMQLFLCDCAINAGTRDFVRSTTLQYQAKTNQLIDSSTYDTNDLFTVVRQPFMEHMKVPTTSDGLPDFSYFAPDCFHFSKKGHGAAAIELWNTMMEPVGKKPTVWNLADTLKCPTGNGFIYTSKNSA